MQNIALQVTLNGIPKAVSNLKELELAITQAREVLLTTTVPGSEAFNKLSAEIANAESKLKNFKKQAEGKDLEASLGDIGKLGGAIAGSFAAATAAVSLFGSESEEVTAAVTTAQNALTLALGARSAAEGLVVVRTLAANLATKALTASTQASTAATRAFYRVLAANPYGAIIAGIGLAVTALIAFTSANNDASESQKEFNKTLNEDTAKSITNLKLLVSTIEDTNLSLETRKKAIQDLRAIFPAYFQDLKDEDILTGNVKIEIDKLTEALIKNARARALQTRLGDLATQELELQKRINDLIQERNKLQEPRRPVDILADPIGALVERGGVEIVTEQINNAQRDLLKIQEQQKTIAEDILQINRQTDGIIGTKGEGEEDTTSELEKQRQLLIDAIRRREEELRLLIKTRTELQKLDEFELSEETKTANDAQRQLNESYEGYISLVESYNQASGKQQQLSYTKQIESLEELTELLDENSNKLKSLDFPQSKILGQRLDLLTKSLKSFNSSISVQNFRDVITSISELEQGDAFDLEEVEKRRLAALELERKIVEEYVAFRIKGSKNVGEVLEIERQEYQKTGQALFTTLKQASSDIDGYEKSIEDAIMELKKLREESQKLSDDPKTLSAWAQKNREQLTNALVIDVGTLEENRQDIEDLEEILLKGRFDQAQRFAFDIQMIEFDLLNQGIDIRKVSYEEKLRLLKNYLEKEVNVTEEAEKKKEDAFQKTINKVQDTIGQLQAALGALSQTFSEAQNLQLDLLEKRYERLQESIIGDSEEANAKRLEAEKIYQAERLRLEKQGAKTQLRISLAQAIANSAQAFTGALTAKPPVLGPILAGITAIASAAQIGIIAQQIQAIDSYRKGGKLKPMAGGGMVFGPAHEYGGVKFQGGGIELEGNESVINRVSTVRYQDLLNQINMAGGGAPIVNNFDDSRIVEAIAKQRREPIRAYVVESDITNKQTIQRRLELLSQI
jgi:hypothetical protein